ncbi:apelin receptor early endogenous ligand-like [Otolemur garnettii]|uniref:apelin receptor early endogenous ligand-like n=1 Tax=Otolemur garnettii TaxID=30611 RepID=UPI000C7F7693|nr:apelin receptor early endogenous ligand-like [Otolemur garnettii]
MNRKSHAEIKVANKEKYFGSHHGEDPAGRPANLAMRRKLHRHNCLQRRCMPLHSRVPFP